MRATAVLSFAGDRMCKVATHGKENGSDRIAKAKKRRRTQIKPTPHTGRIRKVARIKRRQEKTRSSERGSRQVPVVIYALRELRRFFLTGNPAGRTKNHIT
jgi:hypothetical protein